MNAKQRQALKVAVTVMVLMLLFPPFNLGDEVLVRGLTYGFLLDGPIYGRVDVVLLIAQWIAVSLVAGLRYILLSDKT